MNIYQIDSEIERIYEDAIDTETGEIREEFLEQLDSLHMERERKVENVALWYKNTQAEAKAIAEEIKALQGRKKALDTKSEWQERYLEYALHGQRFETPKVSVTYRKSTTVEFDDEEAFCRVNAGLPELVTTKVERKPNKTEIRKLLKDGYLLGGVHLVDHQNMQIK